MSSTGVKGPRLSVPFAIPFDDFIMRAWTVSDAPAFTRALTASEAHLRAWTPWVVDGRVPGLTGAERLATHAAEFASGGPWVYGIFSRDGEVLGGCGLYPRVGPDAVEIGYWLAESATGRGIATRATEALTQVAMSHPGVVRVEIRCDPRNVASARVPERLGFSVDEWLSVASNGLQVWVMRRAQD